MSSMRESVEIKLEVPWGHIAGKTWGSSEAPRVLVVHGILDNAGSFDRLIQLLPDNFYYVAIDLPGHGLSSPLPLGTPLNFLDYVFAIRLVLETLKWDTCIYLGHSFGAQLGNFYSVVYPGIVTKLICLDGFVAEPMQNDELVTHIRESHDLAVAANNLITPPLYTQEECLYALKNKRKFYLNSAAVEALFTRTTTKIGELYSYNRDYRLRNFLRPRFNLDQNIEIITNMKIPTLIIIASSSWLERDCVKQGFEIALKKVGDNFTVKRVRGNHDVHNNNPEVVAPHVCAFLNDAGKSKL